MKRQILPDETKWVEGNVKNVSAKELILMENGGFKMVRLAPHASYPEHSHPDKTEYAYVLSGNPDIKIGPELFSTNPDEFYIFPKNEKHAIMNHSDMESILLIGAIKS